jgi:hypothetical protein
VPIQVEPAQLLYEAWATAKNYRARGPGSEKLKLWHELSVYDRRAWRHVARAFYMAQRQIQVPTLAGRHEVGVYVVDPEAGAWRSSIEARDEGTGIVRDIRDVISGLFASLDAGQQEDETP